MVVRDAIPSTGELIFVLRPNCSLSWPRTRIVLLALLACLTAVAAYFTAKGAWLVLPFAGLEALVLIAGFYLCARRGATREQIRIDEKEIAIDEGGRRLRPVARFPRYWGQVSLVKDPRGWYPSRLYIGSHGRFAEIGQALVESERACLAEELEELIRQGPDLRGSTNPVYPVELKPVSQQTW
jgi:uncharacterized membrane protein